MHEKGYANVGVDDIMQSAKVGKSSFYHFFKSKEALGEAVIGEYSKKVCHEVLDRAFAASVEPLERPRLLTTILADDAKPIKGCLGGNSAAENSTISELLREKTDCFLIELASRFEDAYIEAVGEMELLPDTPVASLAQASVAYVQGVMLLCKVKQSWGPMRELAPMLDNLWRPYAT